MSTIDDSLESATTTESAAALVEGDMFPHLAALRAAHEHFQEYVTGNAKTNPAQTWELVRKLIVKACATGRVLDDDTDRFAALRLITYWVNNLCLTGQPPPPLTTLAEYTETACFELSDSALPYMGLDGSSSNSTEMPGWRRLVRESLDKLSAHRLAAIVGAPGSGRSTLVLKGIIPALQQGALENSNKWRILPAFTPGPNRPLYDLLLTIDPQIDLKSEAALIRKNPARLRELLSAGGVSTVLVIRDFEKLFTTLKQVHVRPFIDSILSLGQETAGSPHYVLLTLSSEAISRVAAHDQLTEAIEQGQVPLRFTTRELRLEIEEPARRVGLVFDPGVVDRLLNDVQGDPAVYPLLQFSLGQLWDHRSGNRITSQSYEELRGGRMALERAAERAYQGLEKEGLGDETKQIITSFVRPDVSGRPTFRTLPLADLQQAAARANVENTDPRSKTNMVLDRLVKVHLVTKLTDDRFELTFPALAESWPRLIDWLADERAERRRAAVLRAAAEKWRDNDSDDTLLWGGPALAEAESYPNLEALELKFLQASRKKERNIKRLRTGLCVAGVALILAFIGIAFYIQNLKIAAARESEIQSTLAKDKLGIRMSLMSVGAGLVRDADSNDRAGAMLWFGEAARLLHTHNKPGVFESQEEASILEENLRLRTGITRRLLPGLQNLISDGNMLTAAFSLNKDNKPDLHWAATVANSNLSTGQSDGKQVRLWDLRLGSRDQKTGVAPTRLLNHTAPIKAVQFASTDDADFLLAAGDSCDSPQAPGAPARVAIAKLWSRPKQGNGDWTAKECNLPEAGTVMLIALSQDGNKSAIVLQQLQGKTRSQSIWLCDNRIADSNDLGAFKKLELPSQRFVNQLAFRPGHSGVLAAAIQFYDDTAEFGEARFWNTINGSPFVWKVAPTLGSTNSTTTALQHVDKSPLRYAGFSYDGRWLITCGGAEGAHSGSAEIWDMNQVLSSNEQRFARPVAQITHDSAVLYGAFNGASGSAPDRFIYCGENGKAFVATFSPYGHQIAPKPLVHGLSIYGADFSPDGHYVATACRDRKVRIWNLQKNDLAFPELNHLGTVNWVGFADDSRTVVSISGGIRTGKADGKDGDQKTQREVQLAHVWELPDHEESWYVPITGTLRYAGLDIDNGHLVVVQARQGQTETRIWKMSPDLMDPPQLDSFPVPGGSDVAFAAMNHGHAEIATLSGQHALLWDMKDSTLRKLLPHHRTVNHACFTGDGSRLITASGDKYKQNGAISVWDAKTGAEAAAPRCQDCWAFVYTAVSPDGKWAVATGGPGPLAEPEGNKEVWAIVWPIDAPEKSIELRGGHTEAVVYAAFSPNSKFLVTASMDNSARVWQIEDSSGEASGQLLRALKKHTADVIHLAFDRHGKYLITAGMDGAAIVWDWREGRDAMTMDHGGEISSVRFNPANSNQIVTAGRDGTVKVWQFQPQERTEGSPRPSPLIATLDHPGGIMAAVFSKDGSHLRTVCRPTQEKQAEGPAANSLSSSTLPLSPARQASSGSAETSRPGFWITDWNLTPADDLTHSTIPQEVAMIAGRAIENLDMSSMSVGKLEDQWKGQQKLSFERAVSRTSPSSKTRFADRESRRADAAGMHPTVLWHLDQLDQSWQSRPDFLARRLNALNRIPTTPVQRLESVLEEYKKAIEADKSNPISMAAHYGFIAEVFFSISQRQLPQNRTRLVQQAIDHFEKSINLNPNAPRLQERVGDAYKELASLSTTEDKWEQSALHYEEAIKLYRNVQAGIPDLMIRMIEVDEHMKRWDSVIDRCTEALSAHASDEIAAGLYDRRAVALSKKDPRDDFRAIDDHILAAQLFRKPIDSISPADPGRPLPYEQQRRISESYSKTNQNYTKALALAEMPSNQYRVAEICRELALIANRAAPVRGPAGWQDAVKHLERATAVPELKTDWVLLRELASACEHTSSWDKSANAYKTALQFAPANERLAITLKLAQAYQMARNWKEADLSFDDAIALSAATDALQVLRLKAQNQVRAGQASGHASEYWDKADQTFDRAIQLASGPERIELWRQKGLAHVQAASLAGASKEHWSKASAAFTSALGLKPDDPYSLLNSRAGAYAKMDRLEDMASDYDKVLEGRPSWAFVLNERARIWAERDQWSKALEDLRRLTKASPKDLQGWHALAVAQLRANDVAGYKSTCQTLVDSFSGTVSQFEANQVAWEIALGNPPGASAEQGIKLVDSALQGNPRYYPYLNTRGVLLYRKNNYQEAVNQLNAGLQFYVGVTGAPPTAPRNEGCATDQLFLAMSYYKLGKTEDARKWLDKAVKWLDAMNAVKAPRPTVWQLAEWQLHLKEARDLIKPGS